MRNGNRRFAVSWRSPGKNRVKHYFKTRAEADAEAEQIRLQKQQTGEAWLALSATERNELLLVWNDAQKRGVSLRAALDAYHPEQVAISRRVQQAYDDFMAEKRRQLVSKRTEHALKSNVGRFVKTCSGRNLVEVKHSDVMAWLEGRKGRTFNSYLTSLNTFFRWCVKMKLLKENPAGTIDKINTRRMADLDEPPAVLTLDQCKRLLVATLKHDKGLVRYVSTCLLAGLRPEREAAKLDPADIDGSIHVRGLTAKSRQARYVEVIPALREWLKLKGDYPLKNLRRRFKAVRVKAGLYEGWQQDCMRHTFASAFYAVHGAERTIAALGHGDYEMLFNHYRRLMKREDAEKILALTPKAVGLK